MYPKLDDIPLLCGRFDRMWACRANSANGQIRRRPPFNEDLRRYHAGSTKAPAAMNQDALTSIEAFMDALPDHLPCQLKPLIGNVNISDR